MVTLKMVQEAQEALKGIARKTPLENANRLGENIYIKSENLQLTGAFKIRGAYNKIRSLTPEEASHGVIACSAGNHAQGIALSATKLGIKSVICMPEGAPISKVEATRSYGAEVVLVPGIYDDAAREAERLSKEHGYTFAHPFNDPYVIAQNDNLVSINSCVQIDLMGQVVSTSVGLRQISGVGGQIDFVRGANMSKGGRAIMAMPSTTGKGKVSKIVPFLDPGSAVTTTRNDVNYVITEYGIAQLRGKTLRQRAEALIEIAHPDFRDALREEYRRRFPRTY